MLGRPPGTKPSVIGWIENKIRTVLPIDNLAGTNFAYLLEHVQADFGVGKDGLLHVAQSLYHDHVPAKRHGLANVWIDRQDQAHGGGFGATATVDTWPTIDHRFEDLVTFADAALR